MQNISNSAQVFANQVESISSNKFSKKIGIIVAVVGAVFTTFAAFFLAAILAPGIGVGGVVGVSLVAGTLAAITIYLIFKKVAQHRQQANDQKASHSHPLKHPPLQQPSVNPKPVYQQVNPQPVYQMNPVVQQPLCQMPVTPEFPFQMPIFPQPLFQMPAYQAAVNQPLVNTPVVPSISSLSTSPLYLAHEKKIEKFKKELTDSLKNLYDFVQAKEQEIRNKINQLEIPESDRNVMHFAAQKIQNISFNSLDKENKCILKFLDICCNILNTPGVGHREYENFHNTISLEIRNLTLIQKNKQDQEFKTLDSTFNPDSANKETLELRDMWKSIAVSINKFFPRQGEKFIFLSANILKTLN